MDAAFPELPWVMEIKETPVFSRRLPDVMDDEEYAFLQYVLVVNPQMGAVIPGTGGIHKLRWAGSGTGEARRGAHSSTLSRLPTSRS